jgi:hypothetical protein
LHLHLSLELPLTAETGVNTETLETGYKADIPGNYKACPEGMKAMPQLRFSIRYDLRKVFPNGWTGTAPIKLASGNAYSSHGNFINGWTEESGRGLLQRVHRQSVMFIMFIKSCHVHYVMSCSSFRHDMNTEFLE